MGQGYIEGQAGGQEFHTVIQSEMPQHIHVASGTSASTDPAGTNIATGNLLASGPAEIYAASGNLVAMSPSSITNTGGSQPHENRQPYLVLNIIIALQGVFPSQN
jgi:microcystin-dependent protein